MVGRIVYLVFGTMLVVLTVGDAIFTDNSAREQHGNLVGVLGGIALMIAATAFRGERQQALTLLPPGPYQGYGVPPAYGPPQGPPAPPQRQY